MCRNDTLARDQLNRVLNWCQPVNRSRILFVEEFLLLYFHRISNSLCSLRYGYVSLSNSITTILQSTMNKPTHRIPNCFTSNSVATLVRPWLQQSNLSSVSDSELVTEQNIYQCFKRNINECVTFYTSKSKHCLECRTISIILIRIAGESIFLVDICPGVSQNCKHSNVSILLRKFQLS